MIKESEEPAPVLLPALIDEIARNEPDAVFLEYPKSEKDCKNGFDSITWTQLANAINGVACHLLKEIGPGEGCETLAYLGPSDARYIFAFVAAMKIGYKLFLTSPRNSNTAHASLFSELKCDKILTTDPSPPSLQNVLAESKVQVLRIASLAELLATPYEPLPFNKTFESSRDDAVWACHTSGTTGLPKARIYTNHFNDGVIRNNNILPPAGYTSLGNLTGHNRSLLLLPLFHPAGIQYGILNAVYNRTINVLSPAALPPSVDALLAMLENTTADWAIMAPATLESLAKNEAQLEQVASKLSMIVFAGGSLPRPLGDVIANKIKLCSAIGSSETGPFPQIYPEGFDFAKDWHYHGIHSTAGVTFERQADDTFEMVVQRCDMVAPHQPVFKLFPELKKYRTKDIFTPHPKWPDMWTHASRSDDVIVFLNGEKTNPVTFEAQVSQHPDVSTAIVFGKQRWEAGLLIELRDTKSLNVTERAQMIEKLWPTIQIANRDAPSHARVSPSHILFVEPDLPVQRTSKDTVRRQISLGQYRERIERLYADAEEMEPSIHDVEHFVNAKDLESVVRIIQEEFQTINSSSEAFGPDTYFFSMGIDSLQVIRVVRRLRQRLSTSHVQPSIVYAHPTARALAEAIHRLCLDEQAAQAEKDEFRRKRVEDCVNRQISLLDQRLESQQPNATATSTNIATNANKKVAVLTGSTGHIGSYILKSLMSRSDVSHIFCLNRSPATDVRQKLRNSEIDPSLPVDFASDRVTFLEVDLSKSNLGLTKQRYQTLVQEATVIFHNAWPVEFNLPLQSFEPHLEGIARLCELSAVGTFRPKLVFVSSISAVLSSALKAASLGQLTFEDVPDDSLSSAPAGYAESKYIAERALEYSAVVHNVPAKIVRVGQVCSAVNSSGRWKRNEWFPSLILGSRFMGCLPSKLGAFGEKTQDIDWIPIDVLADVLVEIGLDMPPNGTSSSEAERVFQIINPHCKAWSELAQAVQEVLPDVRLVSNEEWLEELRKSRDIVQRSSTTNGSEIEADKVLSENPALRLYDFYQTRLRETEIPRWSTSNTLKSSQSFQTIRPIQKEDIQSWVKKLCQG